MSRWHAIAYVRDVPDHELRERLTDALESLYDAQNPRDISFPLMPRGDFFREEIDILESDVKDAERARDIAEDRLETHLLENGDLEAERATVAKLEEQVADLIQRCAELELANESYSDAVAAARKLVSLESRAPRAKHVRGVRRTGGGT